MIDEFEGHICDASGCSKKATVRIAVEVGNLGAISLMLCRDCIPKFQEVEQK